MADVNVNAPAGQVPTMEPPIRTDDQILPHIRWVPIGKRNCYLDVKKSQSNPIYKIAVDILKYTNFFRAFTASSTIPSIYIQQFWDTITPVNNNHAFTSHPSSDALINFVNELGYPKLIRNLSNVEEFTQFIHTFIEDKRNLAQHTHEKKNATLIVISSIRFTKLIIYYLQRKHKFHPRPDSPLHLPNEEPVLGYLKFSAKGTKREVFGMPIPGSLITADIQGASYYQEYLAKVAKHQRYLAGETGSDPDSPTPKPTKTAKKSKRTSPKADPRPPLSKPASTKQLEPKPAPAKTQHKLTTKISDKPSKAKKARPGLVSKRRKPISSLRSMDESVAEYVPKKEPQVDDEEVDVQRALEESLKSMYDVPRGPLPPVVIRKPESGKYQPLPEVSGKGEEKGADAGVRGEGQAKPDPGAQDEGQAGSNPVEQAKGQAGPDPVNAEASQPLPSPIVHVGSDLEHMDLDVADVLTQPPPEQMDEGFTATAYLKVQKNLKLTVEEHVILEEPASSSGFLSSLQHLTKDLSFGDLFFSDKPSKADNDKATAETEAESMVNNNRNNNNNTSTTISTQQSTTDAMMVKRIGELQHIMANLIQENKRLKQRLDSHGARLYTLKQLDIPHQPPPPPPPAGPSRASGSPRASRSSQVAPSPPSPPSANQEGQSKGSAGPSSSKTDASAEYQAWTTTNTRLRLSISLTPTDLPIDDDMALDAQAQLSDDEDIRNDHIPKMKAAYYPDVGLEQMVLDQMWIKEECKYDIAAIIEVFSMYGYEYMKKMVLRRADLYEHVIAERDFKYLYPSDFEDLYLLNLQEDFQLGIESNQTQPNLTKPQWDATGFKYKHDYTIIDSPRAVTFQDRYRVQMIMRFNEIHKLSDGTL
nr:E-beta-farnesene synthase [Tanacetum cinerariifolium]